LIAALILLTGRTSALLDATVGWTALAQQVPGHLIR